MPKSGSRESEGQLAERQSPKRKAEERTRPAESPKRCVPKSGSNEPEGQPAERNLRSRRRKNQLAQRPLRSGACRKAEAVSPKANPPRATPKRCVPKSGSREPEGQLAQWPLRSGACRKAEAVSPKANSPSGHSESVHAETATPSGENHPRRAFAIRRSKPRNEGSAEQCRHTYQYNRKTRL